MFKEPTHSGAYFIREAAFFLTPRLILAVLSPVDFSGTLAYNYSSDFSNTWALILFFGIAGHLHGLFPLSMCQRQGSRLQAALLSRMHHCKGCCSLSPFIFSHQLSKGHLAWPPFVSQPGRKGKDLLALSSCLPGDLFSPLLNLTAGPFSGGQNNLKDNKRGISQGVSLKLLHTFMQKNIRFC